MLLLILCFTALTACSHNVDKTNGRDEVTIAMPKTSENDMGFDPIHGWAVSEHTHDPLIQSTLFKTDVDLKIVSDLASDYEISKDSSSLYITLRDDVVFSDGSKLTSKDVAFTINKVIDTPDNVIDLNNIDSVSTIDDTHVTINGRDINSNLLYTLSTLGIVKCDGYDTIAYGKNPIGSGMYKLKSWEASQSATLVYNEKYYGDEPEIKTINILFMDEDASRAAALSGVADVTYTSASISNSDIDGYSLQDVKSNDTRGISLPCVGASQGGNNTTSNLSVRQAINLAVDRSAIVKNCLNGYGDPAYSVCDNTPWANESLRFNRDTSKAKELLEAAGFTEDADGVRCEINLYYSSSDSTRQSLAYEFSNQMSKIGIKVNPIGTNWDDIYAHQYSDPVLWGWGSNTPLELCNILKSDGSCNFSQFKSSEVDSLLSQENYRDAQNETNIDKASSWAWLCSVDHLYYVKNGLSIGNQQVHPHGHGWSLLNNISKWQWQ